MTAHPETPRPSIPPEGRASSGAALSPRSPRCAFRNHAEEIAALLAERDAMPDPADTARRHEGQIGDLWLPANDPAPTWGEKLLNCAACACAAGIVALVLAMAINWMVM